MSGSSQDDFTSADMFRRLRDIIKRGVVQAVQLSPPRHGRAENQRHRAGWNFV